MFGVMLMEIIDRVRNCIEENGIEVLDNGELGNVESINFISAIISIELEFGIQIPDEYLLSDTMSNLEHLCYIVQTIDKNEEN